MLAILVIWNGSTLSVEQREEHIGFYFDQILRENIPYCVGWYCQRVSTNFNILPIRFQIDIKTIRFMQKFVNSFNTICMLFNNYAIDIMNNILSNYHATSSLDLCLSIKEQFALNWYCWWPVIMLYLCHGVALRWLWSDAFYIGTVMAIYRIRFGR